MLWLLAALSMLGSAHAAGAGGHAEPSRVAPGGSLRLEFVVPADSAPARVALAENVSCTLEGPGLAAPQPCGSETQLIDAQLMPGEAAYVFAMDAPETPGNYTARFVRTDALSALSPHVTDEVSFVVTGPATLDAAGTGPGASLPTGLGSVSDGARWLLASLTGSAAVVASVLVARPPTGGAP